MRVLILGSFSGGNWGDMAILTALTQECHRKWPGCEVFAPTRNPNAMSLWTKNDAVPVQLSGLSSKRPGALMDVVVLDALWQADIVMTTAGMYFTDTDPKRPWLPEILTLFWPPCRWAYALGIPVVGVNCGYVPPISEIGTLLMRDWLSVHSRIGVREKDSKKHAKKLAPKGVPVEAFADNSHLVIPDIPRTKSPEFIGLNLSHRVQRGYPTPELFKEVCECAQAASWKLGLPVRLIQTAAADDKLNRKLGKRYGLDVLRLHGEPEFPVIAEELSKCALLFAFRHHAAVFATSLRVPTIMLGFSSKCRSYMNAVGLGDLTLDPFVLDELEMAESLRGVTRWLIRDVYGADEVAASLDNVNSTRAALARQGFDWATEVV